ncbi:UDP-N-acetylmuramoyl-tripeptide--D-alanyl-D-alanine ligase [Calditerrivibrio nitroreducens]|uniref:UDP-N-acetylmuramoyl-tripeptide--D-alanyl-D-alanine ligase n=1 Tax=Calditerrivibrio nitroreducens (strain DSM 19672 / NBRC 101217 / Yu37-1) TaxID=768670 RepID=E4TFX9_CALNY|nr:UDP-N-acetylmuramoyl-tripeptide--D-alanyl-D-alanine ligase [Calditerrivibrio nitroreducens]ADR19635.1 UDP-N-acetylmuramoylalanyl-D-glutamyl-2,6-diamin opimelate/D-alanyl-D-alanylligase [Calditerrivibrio nitroreducens DSM 19672]
MKRFSVFEVFKDVVKSTVEHIEYSLITIDSRDVKEGSIFFAFKGEKTDGHLYIEQAISKGAVCCVITDENYYDANKPLVLVKDTLYAMRELGRWNLGKFNGKKIVITGSVGKTSTKAILSLVLSQKLKIYEAFKNFNNELGVAIVTSNIDLGAQYAIFEIGTNNPGEIKSLSEFLQPDVGIITGVGHSHIGRFGSLKEITKEKLAISEGVKKDGVLWINDGVDTSYYNFPEGINVKKFGFSKDSDIYIEELNVEKEVNFIVNFNNFRYCFRINHPFSHFAVNALPAIALAFENQFHYEEIYRGLDKFVPVEGRGEIIRTQNKIIINDTYNAGFEAVLSAVENLSKIDAPKKIAILGEMAEIDGFEEKLYSRLKNEVEKRNDIYFYLVGESFKDFQSLENVSYFKDKSELINADILKGDGVYLVKASRSKRFEELVEYLKKGEENAV